MFTIHGFYTGRYCFCALHAHMRMSEALIKPLFDHAEAQGRIPQLNASIHKHCGLEDHFKQAENEGGGGSHWLPIAFKAWQAWRLIRTLEPDVNYHGRDLAIQRVFQDVCAGHVPQDVNMRGAHCALWADFNAVVRTLRCKDPTSKTLEGHAARFREFGARWMMLMPSHRCTTFYLHTVAFHAPEFMEYLLQRNLCIGMMENSGAERRHEYGRRAFRCSGGGGQQVRLWCDVTNRTEFLCLRAVMIWQYGSDLVAHEEARREAGLSRPGDILKARSDLTTEQTQEVLDRDTYEEAILRRKERDRMRAASRRARSKLPADAAAASSSASLAEAADGAEAGADDAARRGDQRSEQQLRAAAAAMRSADEDVPSAMDDAETQEDVALMAAAVADMGCVPPFTFPEDECAEEVETGMAEDDALHSDPMQGSDMDVSTDEDYGSHDDWDESVDWEQFEGDCDSESEGDSDAPDSDADEDADED